MISVGAVTGRPGASTPTRGRIIKLGGALDLAAAPALRERLTGLLHHGTGLLVLDLSRVLSCDVSGLAVLIGAQRRARLLGSVVCLAAPSPPVVKLLRSTGLDRSLTVCPDLPGALAAQQHGSARTPPAPRLAGQGKALPPGLAAG
ncbi:MAG TPA: STAS domain-containing protein [Trebonia sp.]|jgi:anti-anti-sigma factor|nr:STAS domain-containing protein [Trebonia sp.]